MIIRTKAPLRLGFAGGGTDVEPFCNEYGGCVLNVTINLYAYCTLKPRKDGKIIFRSPDMNETFECDATSELEIDKVLPLHKGVYNRIVRQFNQGKPLSFELTTYSDAPSGSGLGTSSTMVVAILRTFVEWLGLPLGEYDVARLAYDIERCDLGFAGGSQDQYAAVFGGLNYMEFYDNHKVIVNPLRLKKWIRYEMENSLVLYYTGKSHDSSKIILEQKKATENKNSSNFEGLLEIKAKARQMKEDVLLGDFRGIAETLNEAWIAKKKTSSAISNPQIDELHDFAMAHGARAAKISGAGGGGVMMCWCNPEDRYSLVEALNGLNKGHVFCVDFVEKGVQSWKLYDEEE
jgi:D-glycero-alpha-D-manno-heptose-7-phosphate kinase